MSDGARIETGTIPGIAPDQSLFPIEKMEAHRRGVLHQAISIFVFDGDMLLLQRRAWSKYHSGGLWANTCCSHPHFGETLDQCAERRLNEELGFSMPLSRRATVDYRAQVGPELWEHERVAVFEGTADSAELVINANPEEVADVCWVPLRKFFADIQENPSVYTQWLQIYARRWSQLGLSIAAPEMATVS